MDGVHFRFSYLENDDVTKMMMMMMMMQPRPQGAFTGFGLSTSKAREKRPGDEVGCDDDDDDDCEDLVMKGADLSSAW